MIRKLIVTSALIAMVSVAACKKQVAADQATEATPPASAEPASAPPTAEAAPPAGSMSGSMSGAAPPEKH